VIRDEDRAGATDPAEFEQDPAGTPPLVIPAQLADQRLHFGRRLSR
jgi:hypothetical protein